MAVPRVCRILVCRSFQQERVDSVSQMHANKDIESCPMAHLGAAEKVDVLIQGRRRKACRPRTEILPWE